VAETVEGVKEVARTIGKPVAVKAQTLAGGRGRAGIVRFADNPEEAGRVASELFGLEHFNERIARVLVEEKVDIAREMYVGITVDSSAKPVMIVSPEGGIEIEEIARDFPEKVTKEYVDPLIGLQDFQVRKLVRRLDLRGDAAAGCAKVIRSLYRLFREHDAILVEINPLALTAAGSLVAIDAKMAVDDSAIYRHGELKEELGKRKAYFVGPELRSALALESGLTAYVELDGSVAVITNGASTGMATMDLMSDMGLQAACFLDVTAYPSVDMMKRALDIVQSNPRAAAILVNILGGGFVRLDVVARGIVEYVKSGRLRLPIVVRLSGVFEDVASDILKEVGIKPFTSTFEAIKEVLRITQRR
jgi:succinyl-CoA synthetase beta subunit